MANINDLDNLLDSEPPIKKRPKKQTQKEKTKSLLNDLKEQLMADPVNINISELTPVADDFPKPINENYINYNDIKKNYKTFANQVIDNIVNTYIHSEKLLNSPRLKDLKQDDKSKFVRILLMLDIAENNMIKLQEFIDGGDMSKEMFDSVNKAQQELRANMKAKDGHLKQCEIYWKNYAELFGLENEEEKIVQEASNKDEDKKRIIVDMSNLTNLINDTMNEKKKTDIEKKDN